MDNKIEQWLNRIYSSFPPTSDDQWHNQVIKDLKGADYNKKLVWNTYETISVKPYYRHSDITTLDYLKDAPPGAFPFVRGVKKQNNAWTIRQDIYSSDPQTAGKMAIQALEMGAEAIGFSACYNEGKVRGVALQSQQDMNTLLQGIYLDAAPIHFNLGVSSPVALTWLVNHLESKHIDGSKIQGALDYDPIGAINKVGFSYGNQDTIIKRCQNLIKFAKQHTPAYVPITVQGSYYAHAGSSAIQELAFSMNAAVEYLHRLTDAGVSLEEALAAISFKYTVGSNYFMEIAKLRAARLMWAAITETFGVSDRGLCAMRMAAQTSTFNKTIYDPHTNMLRLTLEAMAAAIGGSESISVMPHDALFAEPTEFSYRMARNIQLILRHEAAFDKVIDPAGGSYYIESLTDALADKAFALFREIEEKGGFFAAFNAGLIKDKINSVRSARNKATQQRREVLLGTNQFPIAGEKVTDRKNLATAVTLKPSRGHLAPGLNCDFTTLRRELVKDEPIISVIAIMHDTTPSDSPLLTYARGAEEFEMIRQNAEKYAAQQGTPPTVSIISAGNLAMRIARSTFVTNFFGCAGYRIIDNPAFDTLEQMADALSSQKPNIIVVCSSDDEYVGLMQEYKTILTKAVPQAVKIIAGNPVAHIEELKTLGADDFVHVATNAVEFFTNYQQKLGFTL